MSSVIRLCQKLAASRFEIWQACTAPEQLSSWQADVVEGEVCPGGELVLRWPSLHAEARLRVESLIPEREVTLKNGTTQVKLTIEDGQLSLEHSGLASGDESEGTASSWHVSLSHLEHYLAHHRGKVRRVHWTYRAARTAAGLAHAYFTDAAAQSTWLARVSTGFNGDAAPFSLTTHWGAPMSGNVLRSVPERDVVVSWQEQSASVLSFRTFPSPRSAEERIVALSWSCWKEPEDSAAVTSELRAALERLAYRLEPRALA